VLVTIATLDELFKALALDKLSHATKETTKRLLDPPLGYLSGFMAKVDLLYALGVVTTQMYGDVLSINRLRNSCAHTLTPFEFTQDIYEKWLKPTAGARLSEHLVANGFSYLPPHVQIQASPRHWRTTCESALVMNLTVWNVSLSRAGRPPAPSDAPTTPQTSHPPTSAG
jgi:DNA-binding MltR family transcriptional regulator